MELSVIGFYGYAIYRKKQSEKNVLGTVRVSPIKKESLIFSIDDPTVRHFYDLQPNKTIVDDTEWLTEPVQQNINQDGLNDRFNYSIEKPKDTYRIIALGDSFTYGDHVNTKDSWPEQLEDLLNNSAVCPTNQKYEVLNFGVKGYDIQYSAHRYELKGKKYNPDFIIWFVIDNDFTDINEFINPIENELFKQLKNDPRNNKYNPYDLPNIIASQEMHKTYTDEEIQKYQDAVMKDFLNNYSKNLMFTTFTFLAPQYKENLKRWSLLRNGIVFNDGIPNIYTGGTVNVLPDGHPNAKGHQIIAQSIFEYLVKNNLISCESSQSGNLQ